MAFPTSKSFFLHFSIPIPALMNISRPLEDGDIVNIDVTVFLDGYHGDTSRTFAVGDVVCPSLL
jgi:methionine aminopeptidase